MIKISKKNDLIIIDGHSGYSEYGTDIVCSSVSSIAITSVNCILKYDEDALKYKKKDGYLEIEILKKLSREGKKIFVDTNIPTSILHEISDTDHTLIMLADPKISVSRFFDRPDKEKQFIYQLLLAESDPDAAIKNYRAVLERINSRENYDAFKNSGFNVILRDEERSIEETLSLVEKSFKLT